MTFSKYKNEILKNEQFLDLFFKTDLSYYYANLSMLQTETYEIIIDKYLKLNPSAKEFAIFLGYFNNDYKLEKLNNWLYGVDKLYEMINISNDEIIGKII